MHCVVVLVFVGASSRELPRPLFYTTLARKVQRNNNLNYVSTYIFVASKSITELDTLTACKISHMRDWPGSSRGIESIWKVRRVTVAKNNALYSEDPAGSQLPVAAWCGLISVI